METTEKPTPRPKDTQVHSFWSKYADFNRRHPDEMRLLFKGGKLTFRDKWNNVAEHSISQAVAGEAVGDLLSLSEGEKARLVKVALCHDWDKRLERRPGDFSEEERETARKFLEVVNPDRALIATTYPGFHNKVLSGEAAFLEKLVWYLDDITKGSEIAPFEERIAEVESRRPDLDRAFWARERAAGKLFEQELFQILRDRGVSIDKPEDIPLLIKAKVEKKSNPGFSTTTFIEKQAESGDRKNEDTFVVRENDNVLVVAVVDGGSALSSITKVKGVERLSGLFVSRAAVDYINKNYAESASAKDLLLSTNQEIASRLRSLGINPEIASPLELPTASGASIIRIDKVKKTVEVVQAGDTAVLIIWDDGRVELACPVDTPKEDVEAISLARKIAKEENISLKEALRDQRIGDLFVQSRSNENAPDGRGTGALNGREGLSKYLTAHIWSLENIKRIIMLTDGLFLPQEDFSAAPNWGEVAEIVERSGLQGLYRHVVELKSGDPKLSRFPRAKQYDDATGVTVELSTLV